MAIVDLFKQQLKVINAGIPGFKDTLDAVRTPSVHLSWKPPADASAESLNRVRGAAESIAAANREAIARLFAAKPVLVGLKRAREIIPGMTEDTILHAGPPIEWERMCGPMRGAIVGALLYEGRAADADSAEALAASGQIRYAPCHEHAAVGPMAGIVSPSMPVFIIRNDAGSNLAFTTMNEGLGKVLRYGAFGPDVIERLRWMEAVLYPVLRKAVESLGAIDLKGIIAQALHMGDEVHNRNRAATSLLYRALAPAVIRTASKPDDAAAALEFINRNDHFFLNLSMASCKATLDPLEGIPNCSIVTVMARNGTDFGIRVSGTGPTWFTGPADIPDALYFAGFSKADANPDIGDSAITETGGLGGFAIAAAPAIVQFVGGHAGDALRYTTDMYEITAGENPAFQIPSMDFRGAPSGIDLVKVIRKNLTPFIDTGVAHRNPGVGQIGAGVLSAPIMPFIRAFEAFSNTLAQSGGSFQRGMR